jgi:D-3-phosphoglycerate dehydrogenase
MIDDGPVRALLLEGIHPDAAARLASDGYQVETLGRALDEDELIAALGGVHLLGVRSKTQVSAAAIAAAPHLQAIGAFCIGTDQIDLAAASAAGVAVFNAPFSNTRSVVELALAEIIALTRRLTEKNAGMHAGIWDKAAEGSHEVRGRNLGIVGTATSAPSCPCSPRASACGSTSTTPPTGSPSATPAAATSLDELLTVADVVTLHVDGRPATAASSARSSSPGCGADSLFLNLSRGFVIDHAALRRHLDSGHLAGAARRRVPDRAEGPRRRVPLRAARACPTSSSPRTSAVDRGGAGRHRRVRRRQAAPVRREGATTLSVNLPPLALPSSRAPTGWRTCTTTSRRAGRGQQHAGRARGQHRGPAPRHPRRVRLPAHRHRHRLRRGGAQAGCGR